jgi:hypothetical protein
VEAGNVTLGALAPERDRTLVVLSRNGELAVGLRERLERARVVVKDARPEEAGTAVASCRPWPWMLVGDIAELPPGVEPTIAHHPVVVLWLGSPPSGLPAHGRGFFRYSELADAASRALAAEVGGMRLATGAGVELPGGRLARSAGLQALVSAHPEGFNLPLVSFGSAARALSGSAVSLRPRRDPVTGWVSLQ